MKPRMQSILMALACLLVARLTMEVIRFFSPCRICGCNLVGHANRVATGIRGGDLRGSAKVRKRG